MTRFGSCFGFIVPLALFAMVVKSAQQQCETSNAVRMRISVSTRRNTSGHWLMNASASSNVAQRRDPHVHVEAELNIGCPDTEWVTVSTVSSTWKAPLGYDFFRGLGYYKFHNKALNWEDARRTCEAEGSHLMVLNSANETLVVSDYVGQKPVLEDAVNADWYYVGFHDKQKEKEYVTVLGQPQSSGYNVWAPRDGRWLENRDSNCGIVHISLGLATSHCFYKRAYICEIEA